FMAMAIVLVFTSSAMASDTTPSTTPSGTVTIESKSVALGVGVQWGEGVLTYEGKEYHFKVNGLSVVDIGITSISATGEVYHLNKIEDFTGTFMSAEAGIALGGGAGAVGMKNQNDVIMRLTSKKAGVKLKLAPEGIKVQMK
ncbi:MAG: DUF1134 domain-containing protein, partial [Thermodesulfobacteriota bacterium]|nr:DUF1134 domain-containing protein [Thermodesulfobacteriota bacterium]